MGIVLLLSFGASIGIYLLIKFFRKPKKRPRISKKYIFVSSVTDGNEKYFKKDIFGDPVCHDCKNVLESPIKSISFYIEEVPYVYLLSDNRFVCINCMSKYMYRRNKNGDVICTNCGREEAWLQYFRSSNVALCSFCQDDGID